MENGSTFPGKKRRGIWSGFGRKNINYKFLQAISIVLAIATVAIGTFIAIREGKILNQSLQSKGKSFAVYISNISQDPLIMKDFIQLDTIVNLSNKDEEILYSIIRDSKGTIVTSQYASINYNSPRIKDLLKKLAKESEIEETISAIKKHEPVMEISIPIGTGADLVGQVTICLSKYKINKEISATIFYIIVMNLIMTVVLGSVLYAVSKGIIINPITELAKDATFVAAGDLSTGGELRFRVPEQGCDEIQALAHAFSTMAQNLRSVLQQIRDLGSEINSVFANMLEVIQEQASSASQQATSVSEVTATMEELGRTSHQIAGNAEEVKNSAAKSVEMAQQGTVLIRDGVGAMEQIKLRVGEIAKRNQFLGEKSREIGKVMEIIKEIASEIHLLALNAAIESAAAGEHGRRFSVVAAEVRRLAEKTRESTETIRAIVSEIQAATSSSIQATDQGTREVDRWRETINLSSDAFVEIINKVEKTLESSTQISLATHQQTSANEQVVQAMRQVAEMVRVTAGHMGELSKSAGRLKAMVAKFQEATDVFKL